MSGSRNTGGDYKNSGDAIKIVRALSDRQGHRIFSFLNNRNTDTAAALLNDKQANEKYFFIPSEIKGCIDMVMKSESGTISRFPCRIIENNGQYSCEPQQVVNGKLEPIPDATPMLTALINGKLPEQQAAASTSNEYGNLPQTPTQNHEPLPPTPPTQATQTQYGNIGDIDEDVRAAASNQYETVPSADYTDVNFVRDNLALFFRDLDEVKGSYNIEITPNPPDNGGGVVIQFENKENPHSHIGTPLQR